MEAPATMKKPQHRIVKSPEAAGLLNASTFGIWGMIQLFKALRRQSQELKEIEEEENRLKEAAARSSGNER